MRRRHRVPTGVGFGATSASERRRADLFVLDLFGDGPPPPGEDAEAESPGPQDVGAGGAHPRRVGERVRRRRPSGDSIFVRSFGFTNAAERREADLFLASLLGRRASRPHRRATMARGPSQAGFPGEAGEADDCPAYERGEEHASKQEPGILSSPIVTLKADTLLVADFGVDWPQVKPATKTHPALKAFLDAGKANPAVTFEVLGYSDCIDSPEHNDLLRRGRAERVAALVGPRATSVKAAPRGVFVATNLTRSGRALNRGATIRVVTPAPKWAPPVFVRPDSVIEMMELLDDAEGLVVDPTMLDLRMRRRLHGPGPPPSGWKPDVAGALKRIDAVLDFVKPLVEHANVERHGRDDLKATALSLFHTTDWLKTAVKSYDEVRRLRDAVGGGADIGAVIDLTVKAKSALAFRAKEPLKVLADEGLSFELELGSSPKPAPNYHPSLRGQLPGGATLNKRELRVLAWLRDHKDAVLEAERRFRVDRRAIAAVIAWEAMLNIMRGGLRGVGPGKMHVYDSKWAGIVTFLPKGDALPQQVEARGLVPRPASDDARVTLMTTPGGAMTYIAASMRAATDIAATYGFNIHHDLAALHVVLPGLRPGDVGEARQGQEGLRLHEVRRRRPDRRVDRGTPGVPGERAGAAHALTGATGRAPSVR